MLVDAVIAASVVGFAVLGWWEGLARAAWGFSGLLLGAAVGLVLAPWLLARAPLSIWTSMAALAVVLVGAVALREVAVRLEPRARRRLRWEPPARVDRPAGAVFGAGATLAVCWALGLALAGSSLPAVAAAANRSAVLRAVDVPDLPLRTFLLQRFVRLGERADFPRYVDVLTAEEIVAVPAPPADVVEEPGVVAASGSVWRVLGQESMTAEEGSAFVIGPGRLMTAAHVVARAESVTVDTPTGAREATVVACDTEQDVAVLAVDEATTADSLVLELAEDPAATGDPAALIGYPGDGGLTVRPARVRERQEWQSADVFGEGRYAHDAYAVRGTVRPGGSGGPLVTPQGEVLGVVVASSRADAETGYVVTGDSLTPALEAARARPDDAAADCSGAP